MKISTWLVALAFTLGMVGCGGGSTNNASGSGAAAVSKAVAEALTNAVSIPNALLKMGALPAASADQVSVTQNDPPLSMQPGGATIMSLDVDNPDESTDPVESSLVQFSDSDSHFEVPRDSGSGDAGSTKGDAGTPDAQGVAHLMNDLMLDSGVCDNLCNQKFQLKMFQAVVLKSGKVSKHMTRDFELDCTNDGDSKKCASTGSSSKGDAGATSGSGGSKDAGASTGSAGASGGVASYAMELGTAFATFDGAACKCGTAPDKAKNPVYCSTAPYTQAEVTCIQDAVTAAGGSSDTAANCTIGALKTATMACASTCTCTQAAVEAEIATSKCATIPGVASCTGSSGSAGASGGAMDAGIAPVDAGQ